VGLGPGWLGSPWLPFLVHWLPPPGPSLGPGCPPPPRGPGPPPGPWPGPRAWAWLWPGALPPLPWALGLLWAPGLWAPDPPFRALKGPKGALPAPQPRPGPKPVQQPLWASGPCRFCPFRPFSGARALRARNHPGPRPSKAGPMGPNIPLFRGPASGRPRIKLALPGALGPTFSLPGRFLGFLVSGSPFWPLFGTFRRAPKEPWFLDVLVGFCGFQENLLRFKMKGGRSLGLCDFGSILNTSNGSPEF